MRLRNATAGRLSSHAHHLRQRCGAGTGTFGRVYLVRHKETGKFYALKVLRKMDVVRLKQVDHIKNEKNILLELNHPFIVTLYVCSTATTPLLFIILFCVVLFCFCPFYNFNARPRFFGIGGLGLHF